MVGRGGRGASKEGRAREDEGGQVGHEDATAAAQDDVVAHERVEFGVRWLR